MISKSLIRYWGSKPGIIVNDILDYIGIKQGLLLDLFGGAGSIVYTAALNNIKAIYNDINPYAFIIAYLHCSDLPEKLKDTYYSIIKTASKIYKEKMYRIPTRVYNAYLMYPNGKRFLKQRHHIRIIDFFDQDNLIKLSCLHNAISHYIRKHKDLEYKHKLFIIGSFASIIYNSSKMARPNGGTWPVNSYWIPKNTIKKDPFKLFISSCTRILNWKKKHRSFKISLINIKKTKLNIANIEKYDLIFSLSNANSLLNLLEKERMYIDIIVTDPPFTDEVQYFELSYIINVWIHDLLKLVIGDFFRIKTRFYREEIIVNENISKSLTTYLKNIYKILRKSYRVIKPSGYFVLMYHDENPRVVREIIKLGIKAGFKLVNIIIQNMLLNPFEKNIKDKQRRSLYLIYFKKQPY